MPGSQASPAPRGTEVASFAPNAKGMANTSSRSSVPRGASDHQRSPGWGSARSLRWSLAACSATILRTLEAHESTERSGTGLAQVGAGLHERDLKLARDALAGSADARHEFVELMACVPKFLAVMNARMGRPFSDDALQDVVQETLVEIWRRLDSYAGLASLKTWAHRFCQQVLSSRLRSVRRRPRSVELEVSSEPGAELGSSLDYEHVYQALERVDVLGARIVRHKHFDHLSFEEIARRLNLPPSSAKSHYQRTLARLREILDPLRKEAGL